MASKKFIGLLILTAMFLLPFHIRAYFQLPDPANLNIVVNTTEGDDVFHFDLSYENSDSQFPYNSFDLATNNGAASVPVSLNTFGNNTYFISETAPAGWNVGSASCVTDNPGNVISINTGFVQIANPVPDSNTTCIFSNFKVSNKTPILIVPGVLGTDIYQGNNLLWANPKMSFISDGFMDPLAFNTNLIPIDTSLTLGDVIREKGAIGFISHYTDSLINQLTSPDIGYTEGKDLFTFPYDWRFGVSSSTVEQLKGEIDYIASTTGSSIVNVIAHSTGALLVKKYVMTYPSNHHIGKAVFVGIPNLGAPKAIKTLIVGDNFDVPALNPLEMKKISQNMPVVYDLAPSQEYYNQLGSFLHVHNPLSGPADEETDLNFADSMQDLIITNLVNKQAVNNSENLHSEDFDNYDLRNEGVDLYSIVGCKTGTFGKFTESISKDSPPTFSFPKVISGDGTVPFGSADSLAVDGSKTFFTTKIKHGDLLSADGSRQEIVNLLTGSSLSTNGKILTHDAVEQNPSLCEIKGEDLKIHSPLAIDVVDQDGNHSGPLADGSIENSIPGADYEVWGDEKYVFLPTDDNQQYQISVAGTGSGTFTLDDESVDNNVTTQTQVFSDLPVTPALTGSVNLGGDGQQTTLTIQATPTSTPVVVAPSSVVNAEQSEDLTPPVSTSTITGTMGQEGFYRSNVNINIAATDPVVNSDPSQTSGVLKISYNLDNTGYQTYSTNTPITISAEGQHVISFFSTDRAGNNEQEQTIGFTIDKTAPEFVIKFSPSLQDLQFTATDTSVTQLSSSTVATLIKKGFRGFLSCPPPKVLDQDDVITLTDVAGNISQMTFQAKNRKANLKADIKSLTYNGKAADLSKNFLHFDWLYDKKNNLQILTQQVQSKKDFNILAVYGLNKTLITGKDQSGKINKIINGLDLLTITTNQGDLNWNY